VKLRDDLAASDEFALNLTSMTDIVFLMLIFFMLATTYADPESVLGVELPAASSSTETPPRELVINVLEDGRMVLDGAFVDREALRARLEATARAAPATPVTIRGHRLAHHEAIVAVMDACGLAGLSNLSVGTTREERG
jgi:biopolymer transport protein ExbD